MLDEVIFSHRYFMIYVRRKKAGLCGLPEEPTSDEGGGTVLTGRYEICKPV